MFNEPPETGNIQNPGQGQNPPFYINGINTQINGTINEYPYLDPDQGGVISDDDTYYISINPQWTGNVTVTLRMNGLPSSKDSVGGTNIIFLAEAYVNPPTTLGGATFVKDNGTTVISLNNYRDSPISNIHIDLSAIAYYSAPLNNEISYSITIQPGTNPPLPDIAMGAESVASDGQSVNAAYSITGNDLPGPSTIGFYWATGPSFAARIGTTPSAQVSTGTGVGNYVASTSLSSLGTRPANATYVLAVADSPDLTSDDNTNGLILESNESNNVAAVSAPAVSTISIISFAKNMATNPLYSNGNYDGSYEISGAALPNNPNLTLGVYWATGPTASDIIGSPVYSTALVNTTGIQTFSVNMSYFVNPNLNAKYLVVVLDNHHVLPSSEETNNYASIDDNVLHAPLSYELDSTAPPLDIAITREQRVYLWLAAYASTIKSTATQYGIDPRAIAGAIAWEALQNSTSLGNKIAVVGIDALGPGKILPYGDATTVEGTNKFGQLLPVLPVQSNPISRDFYLEDPVHAITYVAAILNAYAVEANAVGINLRTVDKIGVLLTFYEGLPINGSYVTLLTGPKYFAQRVKTFQDTPMVHNTEMGRWVDNNLDYLGMALGN